jgi:dCTP deaminase
MSFLSDRDIMAEMNAGNIICEPFNRENLSAASIDLRLGSKIYRRKRPLLNRLFPRLFQLVPVEFDVDENGRITVVRKPEDFDLIDLTWCGDFILYPGDFVLGETLEYVGQNCAGIQSEVVDKSTIARWGGYTCPAGFIDAGNALRITLEIGNNGHEPIPLRYGMHICQIKFMRLSSPSMQPYDGKYLNADTVECAK